MKDVDDRKIEQLFRNETLADRGFSERIVRRLRFRVWIQRLIMPLALTVGGLIAFPSLLSVLRPLSGMVDALPANLAALSAIEGPQMTSALIAVGCLVAALCFAPMLKD